MHHTQSPDTIHSGKACSEHPLTGNSSVASVMDADLPLLGSCNRFTITRNSLGDLRFQDSGLTSQYFGNEQYSITAATTSTESGRDAYTAYGQPRFTDASGTPQTNQTTTLNARYLYTRRERDQTLGLYHFRPLRMSEVAGRFLTKDPIGFDLRQIDPSGAAVSKVDRQIKASDFQSAKWPGFSKHCGNGDMFGGDFDFYLKIECKDCGRSEPNGRGTALGFAGCKDKNKKTIEVAFCVNRAANLDQVDEILKHEYQHSKDLCGCTQWCDITQQQISESDEGYCKDRTCVEIRACSVDSGCDNPPPGKTNEQYIKDAAMRSLQGEECKAWAERVVDAVWDKCYIPDPTNIPPFPTKY